MRESPPSLASDILQLGKPRITLLVVITTVMGFKMADAGVTDWPRLLTMLVGTALVSLGINSLNQWMERDIDGLMPRTANRPLPTGRLQPTPVLVGGGLATLSGFAVLILGTNTLALGIALLVAVFYLFFYTPLKRITEWNTAIGAVPGALPPVLGWCVVTGQVSLQAVALFLIMFAWQFPHFMPIAWIYREDYARAGLVMISVGDTGGKRIQRNVLVWTVVMVAVSLIPWIIGMAGWLYLAGALLLGAGFFAAALRMARNLNDLNARIMLKASVIYLPFLLLLLLLDSSN